MTRGQQRFYTLHVHLAAACAYSDAIVDVGVVAGTEHLPAKDREYRVILIRLSDGATLDVLSTVPAVRAFCQEHGQTV